MCVVRVVYGVMSSAFVVVMLCFVWLCSCVCACVCVNAFVWPFVFYRVML